ncbi:MAG: hypothetical protein JRJ59_11815, partial [Deltaproteobacteria bacterium]|nr:hypothetical protein [Deltaproteobacteria bacterium]
LLSTCWLLIRFRFRGSTASLVLAGWALGLGGANTSIFFVVVLPPAAAYLAFVLWPRPQGLCATWPQALAKALLFGLPLALSLAYVLGFNAFRYGSPWLNGYEGDHGYPNLTYDGSPGFSVPWWVGLHGYLFSSGKSIFIYSPPLIAALYFLRRFVARFRAEGWLVVVTAAAWLVFYSRWWAWHGDVAWGPRFTVPVTGLLLLSLAQGLADWPRRGPVFKSVLGLLMAAGLAVQIAAVWVSFDVYFASVIKPDYSNQIILFYVPQFSPLLHQFQVAATYHPPDFFLFKTLAAEVMGGLAALAGWLAWLSATAPEPGRQKE